MPSDKDAGNKKNKNRPLAKEEKPEPQAPEMPEGEEAPPRQTEQAAKSGQPRQLEGEVIGIVDAAKPSDIESPETLEQKMKEEEREKLNKPEDEELAKQEAEKEAAELSSERGQGGNEMQRPVVDALKERARMRKRVKRQAEQFPVVGIGASAGGLEALQEFFSKMPRETGMAFVVVTHMSPDHVSLLPELISKFTTIPVTEVSEDVEVKPDHIYVMRPAKLLRIRGGRLHLVGEHDGGTHLTMPIDHFFRSLSSDQCENAICVILSGTGTDGTLGMRSIKAESGMAMVQSPSSAKYSGMPGSAVETGLADYILRPGEMPQQLIKYINGLYAAGRRPEEEAEVLPPESLRDILMLLRSRTGHDFTGYKVSTIRRRIERRMNVHQIQDPQTYIRYVQENAHELDMLFTELLISVTSFFRDPEAYKALQHHCVPQLVTDRIEKDALRVWVPGCCTGEEAYSVAMILHEGIDKGRKGADIQIFGTDLDPHAIEIARAGVYSAGIAVDVPPDFLDRYFLHEDNMYRIRKEIREMLVFAPQNLIKDPPFTKLDLITCRNVLIYLDTEMQRRVLAVFHYALRPGGMLFLGPSETIGSFRDLFDVVDPKWKIFRRKEGVTAVHPAFALPPDRAHGPLAPILPDVRVSNTAATVQRLLLGKFAPATVVADEHGNIVYIHGRTGVYLEPSQGQPRNNMFEMAREGLAQALLTAVRRAAAERTEVTRERVLVKTNGGHSEVNFSVTRLEEPEAVRGLMMITFSTPEPQLPKARRPKAGQEATRVEEVERDLQYTRESLQTTIEELETSNEELKSTNEELQSTNEELQSTNEELETSKEELQSLNEELATVNSELQSKVDELAMANSDMQNLLNNTQIATVFLDRDLNVKRYTERAKDLFNLIASDIGRPLADLTSRLDYTHVLDNCRTVLKTLMVKEKEARTKEGNLYSMRIMPYRTTENVIDGVVITLMDFSQFRTEEEERALVAGFVEPLMEPVILLNLSLTVYYANSEFCKLFKCNPLELQKRPIDDEVNLRWATEKIRELLQSVAERKASVSDVRVEDDFPRLGRKTVVLKAGHVTIPLAGPDLILVLLREQSNK